jgi:hypothetical protein
VVGRAEIMKSAAENDSCVAMEDGESINEEESAHEEKPKDAEANS